MLKTKKTVFSLMALIMVFGSAVPGYTAENAVNSNKNKTVSSAKEKAPITIEGDELSLSDATGQVFAKGNVFVSQNDIQLTTDLLNGNTKESLIWTDSKATMTQPGVSLVGSGGINFNYKDNSGMVKDAAGKVDRQFVTGRNIELLSTNEIIINNGTMTTCPAKVPDYHISATKVEIWPGDKLIAYNAKFWIKDKVIYTLPKYQKSLKEGAAESEFPRLGYSNDDGLAIKQYLEYPLSPKVAAFTNLDYYTRVGFKPSYGLINREKNFNLSVTNGEFEDYDNNWIKKEPEFQFNYFAHRLGNLPVKYTFNAIYGKWTDESKTSWHRDYSLYFTGDPIKLSDSMTLNLGTGFEKVLESYDDSKRDVIRFNSMLNKKWSPRLSTWVGYQYIKNNSSIFEYDNDDLGRELDTGFSYKIDKMNTISFNQSYDLNKDRVYDQDYTWTRDLHCWTANITYRAKRDQIKLDLSVKRW